MILVGVRTLISYSYQQIKITQFRFGKYKMKFLMMKMKMIKLYRILLKDNDEYNIKPS